MPETTNSLRIQVVSLDELAPNAHFSHSKDLKWNRYDKHWTQKEKVKKIPIMIAVEKKCFRHFPVFSTCQSRTCETHKIAKNEK